MDHFLNNLSLYKYCRWTFIIFFFLGCSNASLKTSYSLRAKENRSLEQQKWIAENIKGLENLNQDQMKSVEFVVHIFWSFLQTFDKQELHIKSYLTKNNYPIFIQRGLLIQIIKDDQAITDIFEFSHLKGKKLSEIYGEAYALDKRTMDQLGGEASHRLLIIKAKEIPRAPHGMHNTLYHEFAHLIHQTGLTQIQLDKLELLYKQAKKQNIFHNDYAASNSAEYFACSVEAFLSETKIDKSWHGYADEKQDLIKRDPHMADFIFELLSNKSEQSFR